MKRSAVFALTFMCSISTAFSQAVNYEIWIKTSDIKDAGTDSHITITAYRAYKAEGEATARETTPAGILNTYESSIPPPTVPIFSIRRKVSATAPISSSENGSTSKMAGL